MPKLLMPRLGFFFDGPLPPPTLSEVLHLRFDGANTQCQITGEQPLQSLVNYFMGKDPGKWRTGIPTFRSVRYKDLYPGIDVVFYARQGDLEYDIVVGPGADPARLRLRWEGVSSIEEQPNGDLLLRTQAGALRQQAAAFYQQRQGGRTPCKGQVVVDSRGVAVIHPGLYDTSEPLVVDPVLKFSTYLGGSGTDASSGIAVDKAGNVLVAGTASSADFPSTQVAPWASGYGFLAKFDPTGSTLLFSTRFGGGGSTWISDVALDADANVYVAGLTNAADFPLRNPIQSALKGYTNAFVAKIGSSGDALIYSTYLGGSRHDEASSIAVGLDGSAYVTGWTTSTDFPTANAFQPYHGRDLGGNDAFVAKVDPTGSRLVYSTYLGGNADDYANGIAVGVTGDAYVVGTTGSSDFPQKNPLPVGETGSSAFITRIDPSGSRLVYSTYLAGVKTGANGVAVDASGAAYVVGGTSSVDFPTTSGALQDRLAGTQFLSDAFITKLSADGTALMYSTYVGGSDGACWQQGPSAFPPCRGVEAAYDVAVDSAGNAYVVGDTSSTDLPTTGEIQPHYGGGQSEAFLAELNPSGTALVYCTYLGGSGGEGVGGGPAGYGRRGIAVTPSGDVHVGGWTSSTDFPTMVPFQPRYGGGDSDAFVAGIGKASPDTPNLNASGMPKTGPAPLTVDFAATASGGTPPYAFDWDFGDESPHATAQRPAHSYAKAGHFRVVVTARDSAGAEASNTMFITAEASCPFTCQATVPLTTSGPQGVSFAASGTLSPGCEGEITFHWDFGDGETSREQNPSHLYRSPGVFAWSLGASVGSITCARNGTITVTATPANYSYLVPALAHKPGYYGSQWRADVTVVNLNDAAANLTLAYFSDSTPVLRTAVLPGHATVEWSDVLVSLFGLPPGASTSGVVQVISDVPVASVGRSYNLNDGGTFGGTFPALTTADGLGSGKVGILPQLKRNASYRSNVGFVNLGTFTCTIRVRLLDHGGLKLGERTMDVAAGRWTQLDDVFGKLGAGNADLAYGTVEVLTEGGLVWAYAAVIDNATGDPTTVPVIVP